MVVDDHVDTTTILSSILRRSGYEVAIANDGGEALRAAESFCPEVVLLDLVMPDMHGFEVAQRLREMTFGPSCHLIAVTGWGRPEDGEKFKKLGFREHLMKPFEPTVILDLLTRLSNSPVAQ
jgi:CheY-like chemotaxis protein